MSMKLEEGAPEITTSPTPVVLLAGHPRAEEYLRGARALVTVIFGNRRDLVLSRPERRRTTGSGAAPSVRASAVHYVMTHPMR